MVDKNGVNDGNDNSKDSNNDGSMVDNSQYEQQ